MHVSRATSVAVTLAALAFGILVILIGMAVYEFEPFFTVVGVILGIGFVLAAAFRRPWAYLTAGIVSLLFAFVMFQLNFGGPTGEEVTELAEALDSWFGWFSMW